MLLPSWVGRASGHSPWAGGIPSLLAMLPCSGGPRGGPGPGEGSSRKGPKRHACLGFLEASEVDVKEERPGGWVPQLLRTLWPGWFPASEIPKTQDHE